MCYKNLNGTILYLVTAFRFRKFTKNDPMSATIMGCASYRLEGLIPTHLDWPFKCLGCARTLGLVCLWPDYSRKRLPLLGPPEVATFPVSYRLMVGHGFCQRMRRLCDMRLLDRTVDPAL